MIQPKQNNGLRSFAKVHPSFSTILCTLHEAVLHAGWLYADLRNPYCMQDEPMQASGTRTAHRTSPCGLQGAVLHTGQVYAHLRKPYCMQNRAP